MSTTVFYVIQSTQPQGKVWYDCAQFTKPHMAEAELGRLRATPLSTRGMRFRLVRRTVTEEETA